MRIAIFGNQHQERAQIEHIFDTFLSNNVELYVEEEFYNYLKKTLNLEYKVAGLISSKIADVDLIITIGGDGTFLTTVSAIGKTEIPVMGINTGRLGFLADVTREEVGTVLVDILQGNYKTEKRDLLQLRCEFESFGNSNLALNEVAILKQDTVSMLTIDAYIDNEYLTSYEADGLLVSTPTGSTAYSLSVGGPIMAPTTASFLLAAIAPHSLNARPLIIDNNSKIELEVTSRSKNFLCSLDGKSKILPSGAKLGICKADYQLTIAKPHNHTFYNTLRNKLKWGMDPRDINL